MLIEKPIYKSLLFLNTAGFISSTILVLWDPIFLCQSILFLVSFTGSLKSYLVLRYIEKLQKGR